MSKYEKMVACNRKSSADKIELAKKTIFKMLDEGEKITIPKLIAKTGLSRGFFYKNPIVRSTLDKALEQQVGMTDPRKNHKNGPCRVPRAVQQATKVVAVILALRHRIVYLGIGAVQPCDDVLVFCL